jgi:DNA primase
VRKRGKKQNNLEYVDIQAILDDLNIPYTTKGKNVSQGWIGTQCPFPGCEDHSNHLGLCLDSPVVSCFSCGKSGNYLSYLAAKLNSWTKAVAVIEKHTPLELKRKQTYLKENKVSQVLLPEEATKTPTKYQKQYIEGRGYDLKELETLYDFYYCGPIGNWKNRIIIPIYQNNRLVTFSSIDIAPNSKLRYKHESEERSILHCKELLYGMDQIINYDVVLVVEGFFDKARIGQNCVATMGTLVTEQQIKLLTRFKKVITAFDGDSAGRKNSKKIADNLSVFTEVERVFLPDNSDPDSLEYNDIKELQNMIKTTGF